MTVRQTIYLDSAATTVLAPEIADRLAGLFHRNWANPASQHRDGRQAQAALEDAKDRIKAVCLGSSQLSQLQAWQLIITSGGTEANNLAIGGLLASTASRLFISAVEHPSVLAVGTEVDGLRSRCQILPVDACGQVNLDVLSSWLRDAGPSPLVSIMAGNNETGIVQNLEDIAQICRGHQAVLHCDAVQVLGKLPPTDFVPWVDAFTVTAHKIHGPVGVGGLLVRSGISLRPLLHGGGQQLALRPGTESVPLVVAMADACELAERCRSAGSMLRVAERRDRFEIALLAADIGAQVVGRTIARLPHIASIAFPGLDRQALLMALDMAGIECSSGSACASGSSQSSHVLTAMQLPPLWVEGAVRFSFSRYTRVEEIDEALDRIMAVVKKLRKRS